uniref:P-type domain-containing protein n=1 Tax=Nothobranchius furzeri TaxID=105023 RepID=A0A8C6MCB5_NOTFU
GDRVLSCLVVLMLHSSCKACNLPSEYRLPCGSSSISQTRCLSMGCCFNKHPPACYYPMDGELLPVFLLAFSRHLAKCS